MSLVEKDTELEQSAYRMLTKTFLLLDDFDRRFFAEYGLSTRQFLTLQHLNNDQGRSMIDLSRLLLTDKSNVTGIVDYLERLKYVVRTPSLRDRRVVLVTLTPEGQALCNSVSQEHVARIRELMGAIGREQLHGLLNTLEALAANLEVYLGNESTT